MDSSNPFSDPRDADSHDTEAPDARDKALIARLRAEWEAEDPSGPFDLARGRALLESRVGFVPVRRSLETSPSAENTAFRAVSSRGITSRHIVSPRSGFKRQWAKVMLASAGLAGIVIATLCLRVSKDHGAEQVMHTYATQAGERATITLADGSRVTLAPQTTLGVPEKGGTNRFITLSGEAYFEVAAKQTAPFVVRTGNVQVRVLGTTFSVARYRDDSTTRVAVATGKVAVAGSSAQRPSAIVASGDVAYVTDSTARVIAVSDIDQYLEWTEGRLRFRDAPVADMLIAVGRWYGYEFRCSDSVLAGDRVTATFDRLTAAQALTAVKRLLRVTMKFDDRVITLEPSQRQAVRPDDNNIRFQKNLTPTLTEVGR